MLSESYLFLGLFTKQSISFIV